MIYGKSWARTHTEKGGMHVMAMPCVLGLWSVSGVEGHELGDYGGEVGAVHGRDGLVRALDHRLLQVVDADKHNTEPEGRVGACASPPDT